MQTHNQLAQWNGEGAPGSFNETFKDNFLKTHTNVWVKVTIQPRPCLLTRERAMLPHRLPQPPGASK